MGNEKRSGFHLYDAPGFSDLMNRAMYMEAEACHLIVRSLFLKDCVFSNYLHFEVSWLFVFRNSISVSYS